MFKQKFVTILMLSAFALFTSNTSFANDYKIDNASIDALFVEALEMTDFNFASDFGGSSAMLSAPEPWVAFALSWVVGWCGVHRHYLGTKSSMWAIYLFTCGGIFGIVTFVDWVVLLVGAINEDISKYVDNQAFIMWM